MTAILKIQILLGAMAAFVIVFFIIDKVTAAYRKLMVWITASILILGIVAAVLFTLYIKKMLPKTLAEDPTGSKEMKGMVEEKKEVEKEVKEQPVSSFPIPLISTGKGSHKSGDKITKRNTQGLQKEKQEQDDKDIDDDKKGEEKEDTYLGKSWENIKDFIYHIHPFDVVILISIGLIFLRFLFFETQHSVRKRRKRNGYRRKARGGMQQNMLYPLSLAKDVVLHAVYDIIDVLPNGQIIRDLRPFGDARVAAPDGVSNSPLNRLKQTFKKDPKVMISLTLILVFIVGYAVLLIVAAMRKEDKSEAKEGDDEDKEEENGSDNKESSYEDKEDRQGGDTKNDAPQENSENLSEEDDLGVDTKEDEKEKEGDITSDDEVESDLIEESGGEYEEGGDEGKVEVSTIGKTEESTNKKIEGTVKASERVGWGGLAVMLRGVWLSNAPNTTEKEKQSPKSKKEIKKSRKKNIHYSKKKNVLLGCLVLVTVSIVVISSLKKDFKPTYIETDDPVLKIFERFEITTPSQQRLYNRAIEDIQSIQEGKEEYRLTIATGEPGVGKSFMAELLTEALESMGKACFYGRQGFFDEYGVLYDEEYRNTALVVIDDMEFDLEKDQIIEKYTSGGQKFLEIPPSMDKMSGWISHCEEKGIPVWVSSNVQNFPLYVDKMAEQLGKYDAIYNKKKYDCTYQPIFKLFYDLRDQKDIMLNEEKAKISSIEVNGVAKRKGFADEFGAKKTFDKDEWGIIEKRFSSPRKAGQKGGVVFLSEKTFQSLQQKNIHKLKKKAREGKLFSIERDKGLRIFYLEHGADIPKRIKYFARRCFEDGFVLLVPFPENASPSPKQVFDSIKKDYEKKDGQKRNANAGQLSRWLHSTIIRLEE